MNRFLPYLLLFFFFGIKILPAQNNQLREYTIKDGLPQSQVYDMVQDEKGYLWLGTQGSGLCNFDGDTFQVWNETNGLISNYIHSLYYANDKLYIGTRQGLSIKINSNFLNFESPQINQFYATEDGIYLATKFGVYSFSKSNTFKKITINAEIDSSVINSIIYEDSFFWLATSKGLWKASELSNSAKKIQKIETNDFRSVVFHNQKIYAATFNDGTFVIDLKEKEETILIREPLRINSMSIQNNDELWVATDNDGISIIDTKTNLLKEQINTRNGLAVPHVRKVIKDKQSNIWIATSGGGFYKFFQNSFKHYNTASGLKGNRIYAVHHNKKGLWVSNSEVGLVRIDAKGVHEIPKYKHFSEVKIKTITSDKSGNIWAGSDGRGILFNETKDKYTVIIDSSDVLDVKIDSVSHKVTKNHVINTDTGFPSDWIRKIQVHDNAIWAATYSSGIVKFNYYSENDSLVIRKIYRKKEGLQDLLIHDLVKDNENRLWYVTKNGHLGFIKKGKLTHLGPVLNEKISIGTLLFKNDKLFIGTAGKGIWWSNTSETPSFKKLTGSKALYSENIYQLIFDNQNHLWVGTESGVDKIELNENTEITDAFHFGRNDGFLGVETCLNAVDIDDQGQLWFGAIYGLTRYKSTKNTKAIVIPKVYFKTIKVASNKTIDAIDLKKWTNNNKIVQLKPEQNRLSFVFKTVDVDHPKDIEYRYKLNKNEWSSWSTNNELDFPGLAYGDYQFSVQSRNYRWEESESINFNFYIETPLYKKAWFQWLVFSLLGGVLALYGYFYIRKLKLRNKEEQERLQMKNHLLTLEQKALRLQMNPHFIFNVLNGIKAMASNKPEKMNTTINSFATLLRETLINSRKETISLDQEIKTLKHYIEVEKLMALEHFNYSIAVNSDYDPEEIIIPPMLIQPFVENAIRHGILKGNKEGELKIAFETANDFLHCTITDNGIGIFQSQKTKPKTNHQSMALTVTQERLESISGKEALTISELKNNDGTIEGTSIRFKIPLETDY